MSSVKPKLIVFDLDYTLWPFWVDTHAEPPFKLDESGNVIDATGDTIKCYSDVPEILESLHKEGYVLGIASRTGEIDGAYQLLAIFDWNKYFNYKQIYPGSKTTHFTMIKNESGFSYDQMLFFDDEHRNIRDLEEVGVVSIYVRDGITKQVIKEGLATYAERRK